MTVFVNIPVPGEDCVLRIIDSNTQLSAEDPFIQHLTQLYIDSFEKWGQDLIDNRGRNLALDYLLQYPRRQNALIVVLQLQTHILGAVLVAYGDRELIAHDLIERIAESYEHELRFADGQYGNSIYDVIFQGVLTDRNQYYIEISDFFMEQVEVVNQMVDAYPGDLLAKPVMDIPDEDQSSIAATRRALYGLVDSFYAARQTKTNHKQDDLHRFFSVCLLLGSLTYAQYNLNQPSNEITCVQWTCVGTPLYGTFKLLCSPRGKQIASLVDKNLFMERIASRLPGGQDVIRALVNLSKYSEAIWEGQIGDGSRPRSDRYDYNRILVTKLPLDGIIALTFHWTLHTMFRRRQFWRRQQK